MFERFTEQVREAFAGPKLQDSAKAEKPKPPRTEEEDRTAARRLLILNVILVLFQIGNEYLTFLNEARDTGPASRDLVIVQGGFRVEGGGVYVEEGEGHLVIEDQAGKPRSLTQSQE
jgi:hypothetical protein